MSNDEKFGIFEGLDWNNLKESDDIVADAIKSVAEKGGPAGAILNHALGLTGSEGETFSRAVKSYSSAYNPIFFKMIESLKDDKIRDELLERLAKNHNVVRNLKKKEDK